MSYELAAAICLSVATVAMIGAWLADRPKIKATKRHHHELKNRR